MSIAKEIKSSKDLLSVCKKFKKIAVTGPRRSGTTFMTKQLAKELGYEEVYLENFYTHDEDIFIDFLKNDDNAVIQCPTMCHLLHEVQDDQLLIIYLYRDIKDIISSEKRIHFHDKKNYLRGVHMNEEVFEKSKFLKSNIPNINFYDPISKIKYETWETFQKNLIKNKLEIEYNALQEIFKDEWVNKKERLHFLTRQTQVLTKEDILLNKNQERFSTTDGDHFCQLFVDEGEGYSEKHSIRQRVFSGLNKITFDVHNYNDIKNLRFDPINDYAIVEIIKVESFDKNENSKPLSVEDYNGSLSENKSQIIFEHKDPNIFISGNEPGTALVEITFKLEKLETILRYLLESKTEVQNTENIKEEEAPSAGPAKDNTILLKTINGKLNLQSGELEYLKTVISSLKTLIIKESSERAKNLDIALDNKVASVIEKEEINSKLGEIESTLSERQLTIKSLLDMTGVEIKSALDKINETFESNEKNKVLIESYRKASTSLDKEIAVLNYKLEENLKSKKQLNTELNKLSKRTDKLISENIQLKESVKFVTKSEKSLQTENKKLIAEDKKKAAFIKTFKEEKARIVEEIKEIKLKFEDLTKEYRIQLKKSEKLESELNDKREKLESELNDKKEIESDYNKLLKEINFLSGEL